MTLRHALPALVLSSLVALAAISISGNPREPSDPTLIEINGLKPSYASCSHVDFTLRNVSMSEFYAEVYVENFSAGTWKDDTYPYDIHAPISLYQKRTLTEADRLKPSETWNLSYDRCLQPTFVRRNKAAFRRAIIENDAKENSPVLQRIRVEIYFREGGQLKSPRREWSEPFKRMSEKRSPG